MNEGYAKDSDQESPGFNVTVALSGGAIEMLGQLFIYGPTYDGDVISKAARDELFDLKLIGRYSGYQFLTVAGIKLALTNGLAGKKQALRRQERRRLAKLDAVESMFVVRDGCAGEMVAMALEPQRKETAKDL